VIRRARQAVLAVGMVGATLGLPSVAASAPLSTVSVVSGETTQESLATECDDALWPVDVAESFVIRRDTPGSSQEVAYETSGSAAAGIDYEPLPGVATIPLGADQVRVPVQVRDNSERTRSVTLTITILPRADYTVGDPASATINFISDRDPSLPHVDCNPEFVLTDAASNREQTIRVGGRPLPVQTTGGPSFFMRVVGGSLPPGVRLDPGSMFVDPTYGHGGGFLGAATTTGTFAATLEVCPTRYVFTCRTTTLTVHVLPRGAGLPQTGASLALETFAALSLIAVGRRLRSAAGRRRQRIS